MAVKTYKYSVVRKRFLQFCKKYKANPEDVLGYCEGRLSNFPQWYVDYLNCMRNEIRNRIKTGIYKDIRLEDIWS